MCAIDTLNTFRLRPGLSPPHQQTPGGVQADRGLRGHRRSGDDRPRGAGRLGRPAVLPDLDSPAVFAALVDDEQGGRFRIGPAEEGARLKQLYLPDTNVLLTRFLSADGVGEVTDFMPVGEVRHAHCLVRRVTCVRGPFTFSLPVRTALRLRTGPDGRPAAWRHGRVPREGRRPHAAVARARAVRADEWRGQRGDDAQGRSDGRPRARGGRRRRPHTRPRRGLGGSSVPAHRRLLAGLGRAFALPRPLVGHGDPLGPGHEAADVSAVRIHRRSRHVRVARDGGRPAQLGLPLHLGPRRVTHRRRADPARLPDEAHAFVDWITERYREAPEPGRLQIMYGIDGRHELTEEILDHLEGTADRAGADRKRRVRPAAARHLRRTALHDRPLRRPSRAPLLRPVAAPARTPSSGSETIGSARTRAFGRCAAAGRNSSTPGS